MITSILPRRVRTLMREAMQKLTQEYEQAPVEAIRARSRFEDPRFHEEAKSSSTCLGSDGHGCGNEKPTGRYFCFMCAPGRK